MASSVCYRSLSVRTGKGNKFEVQIKYFKHFRSLFSFYVLSYVCLLQVALGGT